MPALRMNYTRDPSISVGSNIPIPLKANSSKRLIVSVKKAKSMGLKVSIGNGWLGRSGGLIKLT